MYATIFQGLMLNWYSRLDLFTLRDLLSQSERCARKRQKPRKPETTKSHIEYTRTTNFMYWKPIQTHWARIGHDQARVATRFQQMPGSRRATLLNLNLWFPGSVPRSGCMPHPACEKTKLRLASLEPIFLTRVDSLTTWEKQNR